MKYVTLFLLLLAPSIISPMHPAVRLLMAGTGGASIGYVVKRSDNNNMYVEVGSTLAMGALCAGLMISKNISPLERAATAGTITISNLTALFLVPSANSDRPKEY